MGMHCFCSQAQEQVSKSEIYLAISIGISKIYLAISIGISINYWCIHGIFYKKSTITTVESH